MTIGDATAMKVERLPDSALLRNRLAALVKDCAQFQCVHDGSAWVLAYPHREPLDDQPLPERAIA